MPSIKLPSGIKSQEVKSGFEAYDGPIPTQRGFYRALIRSMKWGKNSGGSYGFTIVADLQAASGDPKNHAQFDGFTMFSHSIITETADGSALKEGSVNNLSNLYFALGAKDDPNIVIAKGDPDESKLDVLKFDGKNPVGHVINIDMGFETYNGEQRPTASGIFKFKEEAKSSGAKPTFKPSDDEEEDEDEDLQEDDAEFAAREEELNGLKLAEIKKIAKELKVTGKNKAEIIEAILDAEFPEDGAAALDEEDEEEDDESEEVEEAEDDEEEEDDDEEEDDEEEEDEDDEALQERSAELNNFDRAALKKIVKEVAPDFTVLKRHSDEDIREAILAAEFGDDETPF